MSIEVEHTEEKFNQLMTEQMGSSINLIKEVCAKPIIVPADVPMKEQQDEDIIPINPELAKRISYVQENAIQADKDLIEAIAHIRQKREIKKYNTCFVFRKPSKWKCWLNGFGTGQGTCFVPLEGQEPNWFWRKMQFLCFGFKWVKE